MTDLNASPRWPAWLLLLALSPACASYLPFTDRAADQYELAPRDRGLLQYFVSDDFSLRRDTTDTNAHITPGGTIRYYKGRQIEELRVRRYTPGIAVGTREGVLALSFMPGDERSTIPFAVDVDPRAEYSEDAERGRFAAPPPDGPRSAREARGAAADRDARAAAGDRYSLQGDEAHPIRYDGKLWSVHYERRPYLLIRSKDIVDKSTKVTTLPGRVVGK